MPETTRPSVTVCDVTDNHPHDSEPAAWDVSFPNGDWENCAVCSDCLDEMLDNALHDLATVMTLVPVGYKPRRRITGFEQFEDAPAKGSSEAVRQTPNEPNRTTASGSSTGEAS